MSKIDNDYIRWANAHGKSVLFSVAGCSADDLRSVRCEWCGKEREKHYRGEIGRILPCRCDEAEKKRAAK